MKLPQAVEINKGGLRRLLLDEFHKLLEKAFAKNAPAFFTVQTGITAPATAILRLRQRKPKTRKRHLHKIPDTSIFPLDWAFPDEE